MAQEWFYTNDGKSKFGPVSAAELVALAKTGQIMPATMVWKQGMTEWKAACTIKGLFANPESTPHSPFAHAPGLETRAATMLLISRLSLGLAIFFSLLAAVIALLRVIFQIEGGAVLNPIIAGLAVLLGLVAGGIGLSERKSRPFMESATTAVFLGVAALLFSIGSSITARTIKEGRDASAIVSEVETERRRTESARKAAKELRDEAEAKREAAVSEPKKLMESVEQREARLRADRGQSLLSTKTTL